MDATWSALIVDDDPGVRQSVRLCLESDNARVLGVGTSSGALDALERKDLSRYVDAMTDDVQVDTPERTLHGKDDAKAYYNRMHKAIGQLDTTVQNAWGVSRPRRPGAGWSQR